MPQNRYVAAVKRQRERIVKGLALHYFDDDTPGNKSTECTWGLCSGEVSAWPDAQDHLWPDKFTVHGRVAPLYLKPTQKCPMDRRPLKDSDMNGCFYTCRIFNPAKSEPRVTREIAITLYDARLRELE
jgi:hypothetical protein